LRELRRHGQFVIPTICREAWEDYKRESNPAREYLTESFEAASADNVFSCTSIYTDYKEWCHERGLKPLDDTKFGKELRKVFPGVDRRRESSGQRSWKYHGLRAIGVETTLLPIDILALRRGV